MDRRERSGRPLLVFLHEGLGSRSMWRDFPQRLCDAAGCRGLVYSRPGYGRSTPRAHDRTLGRGLHAPPGARSAARAARRRCASSEPPWLFGHSDGASIALLHAARFPSRGAGLIVLAPHLFVEELSVASIERTRRGLRKDRSARSGWRATTTTSARPSGAGTTSGWTPRSAPGTSRPSSTPSAARCWPSRAWTTSTARWNRCAASGAACRRRGCWSCPTAGTRRTAISPNR